MGAQYHAGFRLAAVATLLVVVLANLDPVERQNGRELRIDLIDVNAVRSATRDIRLVGDDNQHKAFALQFVERRAGAGCDDKLTQITWRVRPAVAEDYFIQYTVAVEKDSRLGRLHRQRVASHFVCRILRSGWVTSKCQITAWKASECGVTASGFTVGTIETASPTFAV